VVLHHLADDIGGVDVHQVGKLFDRHKRRQLHLRRGALHRCDARHAETSAALRARAAAPLAAAPARSRPSRSSERALALPGRAAVAAAGASRTSRRTPRPAVRAAPSAWRRTPGASRAYGSNRRPTRLLFGAISPFTLPPTRRLNHNIVYLLWHNISFSN